jgi:hypothetical protein
MDRKVFDTGSECESGHELIRFSGLNCPLCIERKAWNEASESWVVTLDGMMRLNNDYLISDASKQAEIESIKTQYANIQKLISDKSILQYNRLQKVLFEYQSSIALKNSLISELDKEIIELKKMVIGYRTRLQITNL